MLQCEILQKQQATKIISLPAFLNVRDVLQYVCKTKHRSKTSTQLHRISTQTFISLVAGFSRRIAAFQVLRRVTRVRSIPHAVISECTSCCQTSLGLQLSCLPSTLNYWKVLTRFTPHPTSSYGQTIETGFPSSPYYLPLQGYP